MASLQPIDQVCINSAKNWLRCKTGLCLTGQWISRITWSTRGKLFASLLDQKVSNLRNLGPLITSKLSWFKYIPLGTLQVTFGSLWHWKDLLHTLMPHFKVSNDLLFPRNSPKLACLIVTCWSHFKCTQNHYFSTMIKCCAGTFDFKLHSTVINVGFIHLWTPKCLVQKQVYC